MAKRIEPYGGAIVPHDKTVYGEMRFSFNMVSGMTLKPNPNPNP